MIDMNSAPRIEDGEKLGLVTLNVNGFWQPTSVDTGKTSEFWAFTSRFVVDSHYDLAEGHSVITHAGRWMDRAKAERFASSIGRKVDGAYNWAEVREVPVYWWAPAYGEVTNVTEV